MSTIPEPLNESSGYAVSAMSTPDGQPEWISFKKHEGDTIMSCHYVKGGNAGAWSSNTSMGSSNLLDCQHEAALAWSNNWVYAVWDTQLSGNPLYWRRTPLKLPVVGAGYVPDKPNPKDAKVGMIQMGMAPVQDAALDISKPGWVLDQGTANSCTANAVATACRYELSRQGKADFMTSRLYLYYLARLGAGKLAANSAFNTPAFYNSLASSPPTDDLKDDCGSYIREAVRVLGSLGAVSEDDWGYEWVVVEGSTTISGNVIQSQLFATECNASYPPQNGCFQTAKKHFTVKYDLAELETECWKRCIQLGYPIIFGFNMYDSFNTFKDQAWNKKIDGDVVAPVPNTESEGTHGAHAVLAVGWNNQLDTSGCFLVQNWWGQS
ncbi:hypothetical protein CEP54_002658 [Fusarium duplospermum]|uniref:Peptidase C1A papain C-terminal domain-containing protein n=1 Tax=Fusarium duplospermum TaxID=1325734 RepID=A0A428QTT9_9HYPO|nr:hypothetical protein CEP54_002658 [Fusarium duplospermum]